MPIRPIVYYPDDRLLKKCNRVKNVNDDVRRLVSDLIETMYANRGIGLAAPQIGVNRRVIVVDAYQGDEEEKDPIGIINPEIVEESDEQELGEEGCLSIPGVRAEVLRRVDVIVEGLDTEGQTIRLETSDLEARVFQHEIDHLNGILFIDYIDSLNREVLMKEYMEQAQVRKGK